MWTDGTMTLTAGVSSTPMMQATQRAELRNIQRVSLMSAHRILFVTSTVVVVGDDRLFFCQP